MKVSFKCCKIVKIVVEMNNQSKKNSILSYVGPSTECFKKQKQKTQSAIDASISLMW